MFHWRTWQLVLAAVAFGGTEATFLAANLTKVFHGGWLPLLIAAVMFTLMTTWQKGRTIITERRRRGEGPLAEFVEHLHANPVIRIPGTAIFPHPTKETTPLALRANVAHNHVLHEHVVIVSAVTQNVPHVDPADQITIDDLGHAHDGIVHIVLSYGFADDLHIPDGLRAAAGHDGWEMAIDPDTASYFVSGPTSLCPRRRDVEVAQAAVHHVGPQRRGPLGAVRPARSADRRHGYAPRPLSGTSGLSRGDRARRRSGCCPATSC